MKRITTILLTAALVLSLIAPAIAVTPPFPDITDTETAKAAAVLQMLRVMEGDGVGFNPDGYLTRAEFCKMSVVIMGKGKEEPQNRSRTIFPDVNSTHWARGFINISATGDNRLIAGYSDGTFRPDEQITYAQAVTILLRMLGYTDADAGLLWPDDHMRLAETVGLTDGIAGDAREPIARSSAARLFVNMLTSEQKSGGKFYTTLGTANENVIILSLDAELPGGVKEGIKTTSGVYESKNGVVPEVFQGMRGALIVADGQAVTFIPDTGKSESILASDANSTWVRTQSGKQYDIPSGTRVFSEDGETTYGEIFKDISNGTHVTLYYNKGGAVDAVYIRREIAESALIVMSASASASAFNPLTGGVAGVTVYRNGLAASYGDICKYDVATFDKTSRVLSVSDFRVSAYYENAWPNPEYPTTVRFMGKDFPVLPSAHESLSAYRPGETLTFLLSADNQVAGVIPVSELRAAPIGLAESVSSGSATVTLLNGITFTGNVDLTSEQAAKLSGELVTISGSSGGLNLSRLITSTSYAVGPDLDAMTYGTTKISSGVLIFDKLRNSGLVPVSPSELMQSRINARNILYIGHDTSGKVNLIITNDLTGDLYQYGFLSKRRPAQDEVYQQDKVSVTNSTGSSSYYYTTYEFADGEAGGIVPSADGSEITAQVSLTRADNVRRSAFKTISGRLYVTIRGEDFPVASDVQCYNKASGIWFSSIDEARDFSDTLTVYYDRPPLENGKIRLVVTG